MFKYKCKEIKKNNSKKTGLICRFDLFFASGIYVKIITGNLFKSKTRKLKIILKNDKFFEYNNISKSLTFEEKIINLNTEKNQPIQTLLNQFYLNIQNGYQQNQFENVKISSLSIKILESFYKC